MAMQFSMNTLSNSPDPSLSPPPGTTIPGRFAVSLTGGIGSGKTTVANIFAEYGATIIDADAIAHALCAPGGKAIDQIRSTFGTDFINAAGGLDRARMRTHVFADSAARKQLETILHPMIRNETALAATTAQGDYLMLVIPLLAESKRWQHFTSRVLVVDCSKSLQIDRVMRRSNLTRAEVEAIMATQASRSQRLAIADDVIKNEGEIDIILPQIIRLHTLYCTLSKTIRAEHL